MANDKLEKHTLRLRPGDVDFIRDRFPRPGANAIIRRIISNFVDKVQGDNAAPVNVSLEEDDINV